MDKEPNQVQDILECIRHHDGIDAEKIARETGWNRHVVDVALPMLLNAGLIMVRGRTEWDDALYVIDR